MTRAPFVQGKATEAFSRHAEIYDTTIGWRFVNPLTEGAVRRRFDAGDGGERGAGLPDQPRRPGRLRPAQPAARRGRPGQSGFFAREMTPVTIKGRKGDTVVDRDEHPRETSLEALAKLKAPFRKEGRLGHGRQCVRRE